MGSARPITAGLSAIARKGFQVAALVLRRTKLNCVGKGPEIVDFSEYGQGENSPTDDAKQDDNRA